MSVVGLPSDRLAILSPEDQADYLALQLSLKTPSCRYNRNHRMNMFIEALTKIIAFCERSPNGRWSRSLVCGICTVPDGIAVNVKRLKALLGKSKSAVNGIFQNLAYETVSAASIDAHELKSNLQRLNCVSELRQWSIKRFHLPTLAPATQIPECVDVICPCPKGSDEPHDEAGETLGDQCRFGFENSAPEMDPKSFKHSDELNWMFDSGWI
jgi:hypothetical protein